jgi:hypothetical protein
MDIENLEREELKFAASEQARSDRDLLDSHEERPVTELDRLWLEQACLRAVQIDAGEVELVSGEEVERRASELLR